MTLSLWVITVTVAFGEEKCLPPPLVWESSDLEKSFAKAFLPNPEVNRITISEGLLQSFEDQQVVTPPLVNPHQLALDCRSVVPATEILYNGVLFGRDATDPDYRVPQPMVNGKPTELGVRPMRKSALYSLLEITLAPLGDTSDAAKEHLKKYVQVEFTTKSVPLALWSNTDLDLKTPPQDQMIDGALVGLIIRTKPGPRSWETEALDLQVLAFDPKDKQFDWSRISPTGAFPANKCTDFENLANIEESKIVRQRREIVNLLRKIHPELMNPDDIELPQLQKNAQYIFQAPPLMARVGQEPPRTSI